MVSWQDIPDDDIAAGYYAPEPLSQISPDAAMNLAFAAALNGFGHVTPNPAVGAVAVDKEHRFIGCGFHGHFGGPHAEVEVLSSIAKNNLNDRLNGATFYVTLEPCSFHGKTPSCAQTLAKLPISKVLYAVLDPNDKVNGLGLDILTKAGITCEHFAKYQARGERLLDIFSWHQKSKSPYVALKAATTLDGTYAFTGGGNMPITGERARDYGHFLRLKYDAIMVGQNTLIADNPRLDCRTQRATPRNPLKVFLDPDLRAIKHRAIKEQNFLKSNPERSFLFVDRHLEDDPLLKNLQSLGLKVVLLNTEGGFFNPQEVLAKLYSHGIFSVLLEGGGGLWGTFLQAGLVNKIHLFQSAKVFEGPDRLHWLHGTDEKKSWPCKNTRIMPLSSDWVIESER